MVYLLKAHPSSSARPVPPQRRRTIIIGGGLTGVSAAVHLGEHCLLLERRTSLEESNDHSHNFPLGAARSSALGVEGPGPDGERKARFLAWRPAGEAPADGDELIRDDRSKTGSLRALVPLLRGELRLGGNVVRVTPSLHLVELADGSRFVYDKLLSTVSILETATLVMHELASRISHAEFFRYWLSECDIEVADRATQSCRGDVDEIAAGKRVAALINRALAGRFQQRRRGSSFFEPRLVQATTTATP
jgi:hypothetical protein